MRNLKTISRTIWCAFIALSLIVINFFILPNMVSHSVEEQNADLILKLEQPASAIKDTNFTFKATVSNIGPDNADGSKFRINFDGFARRLSIECVEVKNGAACPSNIQITENDGVNNPYITGDLATVPRNGEIIFNIKGIYPANKTSITTRFEANTPDNVTDTDLSTNQIEQQTSLRDRRTSINVSTVQDKEDIRSGESRTYTTTYLNDGDVDYTMRISESSIYRLYENDNDLSVTDVKLTSTVTCDPNESTIECPDYFPHTAPEINSHRHTHYYTDVTIPVGKKLVIKNTVNVEQTCGLENQYIKVTYENPKNSIEGKILLPECSKPNIVVTNTQDKETVGLGEERVHTVTYENVGDVPADLILYVSHESNIFDGTREYGYAYTESRSTVTCDSDASTADCPTGLPYESRSDSSQYHTHAQKTVTLEPGKKLVLKSRVIIDNICNSKDYVKVTNSARARLANMRAVFSNGEKVVNAQTVGKVTIPNCPEATISVTKTQEKDTTSFGEERVYTVTYENTGNIDAKVIVADSEEYSFYSKGKKVGPIEADVKSTTICDSAESTMDCPTSFPHSTQRSVSSGNTYFYQPVTIPVGKKLVLKTTVLVDGFCSDYDYIQSENTASVYSNDDNLVLTGENRQAKVIGKINNIPSCVRPTVTVTKTQDKEVVEMGGERVYTITYENTSDADAKLRISDYFRFDPYINGQHARKNARLVGASRLKCDAGESTMDCPTDIDGERRIDSNTGFSLWDKKVTIPAGKKLVLKNTILINDRCENYDYVHINNLAQLQSGSPEVILTEQSVKTSEVVGKIICADISTQISTSPNSVVPGDKVVVTSTIDNSVGMAENVPFEMSLPMLGANQGFKKILDATNFTPTCAVNNGQAQCPTDLKYDPNTNKVSGTIPLMKANSNISISIESIFTSSGRFTESYKVSSQAFPVKGDLNLGIEGKNYSTDTFGWTNIKPIDYPPAPQVNDQCGTNNAVWVDPGMSDEVTWSFEDNNRVAKATVKDGYIFTDGKRTKDYGVAPDSNELCPDSVIPIEVPKTPEVEDKCGLDNARWIVPAETAQVRWELKSDKHLIAHAKDSFRFGGNKVSHDFGAPKDSGVECEKPKEPKNPTPVLVKKKELPNTGLDSQISLLMVFAFLTGGLLMLVSRREN